MLPVYNGDDIVGEVIKHLLSQGLDLVVLDNGSTDNSYKICKKFANKNLIHLKQFKTPTFNFALILRILYDMALQRNPDWLIRSDQDEFLESGEKNLTLKNAIKKIDSKGYNLIQFDCFEFFMTNNDNKKANSIRKKLPYYSWQHNFVFRAWKHTPGTRVEVGAGHFPVFPEEISNKISPKRFVLRHYRFRNNKQAKRNQDERLKRTNKIPELKLGWFLHLKRISKERFFEPVDYKIF